MGEEDMTKDIFDIFGKDIVFNWKNYSKVREYLDFHPYMHGRDGNKSCVVYLTNRSNPNQMPYCITLHIKDSGDNLVGVLSIQKNHPLGKQIKKSLGELLKE